jgi:hypothetical protein
VEKAVEVVRTHEDGTCSARGSVGPKDVARHVGVDTEPRDDGGEIFEQTCTRSPSLNGPDDARCVSKDECDE